MMIYCSYLVTQENLDTLSGDVFPCRISSGPEARAQQAPMRACIHTRQRQYLKRGAWCHGVTDTGKHSGKYSGIPRAASE
jgi:hypothetical protein